MKFLNSKTNSLPNAMSNQILLQTPHIERVFRCVNKYTGKLCQIHKLNEHFTVNISWLSFPQNIFDFYSEIFQKHHGHQLRELNL